MKKFLAILVLSLFLTIPSQANDIKDFQIDGISTGDSLLDHTNERYINDNSATRPSRSSKVKTYVTELYVIRHYLIHDGINIVDTYLLYL